MRTKALLVAAATGFAALSTSLAQVYSVNVVGYVNVSLSAGYNLIANPLSTTSNTIQDLLPGVDGMAFFKYVNGAYQSANYVELIGGWDNPTLTLDPGEGAFVFTPSATVVTFVGEVMEGSLSNPIPAGLSMKSSMVPQAGTLSALAYPVQDGDTVYKFSSALQTYVTANYLELIGGWDTGVEPSLEVGEAIFVSKAAASSWNRDFTVPRN